MNPHIVADTQASRKVAAPSVLAWKTLKAHAKHDTRLAADLSTLKTRFPRAGRADSWESSPLVVSAVLAALDARRPLVGRVLRSKLGISAPPGEGDFTRVNPEPKQAPASATPEPQEPRRDSGATGETVPTAEPVPDKALVVGVTFSRVHYTPYREIDPALRGYAVKWNNPQFVIHTVKAVTSTHATTDKGLTFHISMWQFLRGGVE